MNDFRGIGIELGCDVSFVDRSKFKNGQPGWGTVTGFSVKMVRVYIPYQDRTATYMPHNCCVIQQPKETPMKES